MPPPTGRAQILGTNEGRTLGAGVLVSPSLVVTVWHVVHDGQRPVDELSVRLPDDASARRISASVETEVPIGRHGDGDIAVLRLAEEVSTTPARVRDGIDKLEADVFGYPNGTDTGVWAAVRLRGSADAVTDWYQLDRISGSAAVERGFSGSGVYVDGLVIGLVVARMRMPEHVAAWMLPVRRWLDLLPGVSSVKHERSEIDFTQRMQLVTAMSRVSLLMDVEGRRLVARNLPEHIRLRVPASAVTNLDLLGLLDAVLGFQAGFEEFYQVVIGLSGETAKPVTQLGQLARNLGLLGSGEPG